METLTTAAEGRGYTLSIVLVNCAVVINGRPGRRLTHRRSKLSNTSKQRLQDDGHNSSTVAIDLGQDG